MTKHKWQLASTFVLLALLLSSAVGCTVIPVESSQKSAPIAPGETNGAGTLTTSTRPAINSFQVRPEVISAGIPATLSWDVSGTMSVNMQPDVGNVGPSGSQQLSPNSTATYTLTATNDAGSSTSQATVTVTPASSGTGATVLVGCDPVSGRAEEVNLCWEQLCVANGYDIEIAKDNAFTTRVIDWVTAGASTGFLTPVDVTKPCVYFPAGGEAPTIASTIAAWGNLECGHQYFWRVQVRQCATGQIIRSPWSDVHSFTVKAGLPVRADYYGLKLLSPDNGCLGCPVQPVSFSWSPFKDTTKYKFVLAKDAAMTQIIAEAEVPTTAYEYNGKLDYSTNYFWRVMALEPAPSDWSATFSFQTEPAPAAPASPAEAPATPLWVWVVIAIGAILVIVTLVLTFKTRRV